MTEQSLLTQNAQLRTALQAAREVFEYLDGVDWPATSADVFYGRKGACPVNYHQAQELANEALERNEV